MNRIQNCALRAAFALLLAAALTPAHLEAQEQSSSQTAERTSLAEPIAVPAKRVPIETSVSIGVAAQLSATRVAGATQYLGAQSFDPSAGILSSIHQSFRPWLGYTANFGYTRTTEENAGSLSNAATRSFAVPSNIYEMSLTYMLQKHITRKLTGFVDLGGGVLTFLPTQETSTAVAFSSPSVLFRQLGVAGGGLDYHFSTRLAFRAEYRGLLYKYPDYGGLVGRQVTVSSQPTLSLTYTFGRRNNIK